jgi:PadR family transcriptional regulator PadR
VPRPRQLSPQTVAVLLALAAEPATWRYGYELGQEVGLKAGSLYPILIRLSDRGLLEATWESEPPAGRPPRHLYRLTETGRGQAAEAGERSPEPAPAKQAAKPDASRRGELRGAW